MGHPAKSTQFSEAVVTWKSVVPSTLDVQCCQVHSKAFVSSLEQVIGQLVGHDVVKMLARLTSKPHQESVEATRSVNQLWVEKLLGKWDRAYSSPLDGGFLNKAGNECV